MRLDFRRPTRHYRPHFSAWPTSCRIPIASATADVVVSTNVLEHVRDDEAALIEILRVLRPGGRAALVVPAGRGIYDYYDRFLRHERRYGRRELPRGLDGPGFTSSAKPFSERFFTRLSGS